MGRLVLAFAVLFCYQAKAYWISEHELITREAMRGLQSCRLLGPHWDRYAENEVVSGNRGEDTNLFRKWTRYSHYYNPYRSLDMWREDSSATVKESTEQLEKSLRGRHRDHWASQGAFGLMGRIVHHLQDVTVPSHVTPVNHWATDGFEGFTVSELLIHQSAEDCREILQDLAENPFQLLRETAIGTIEGMKDQFTYMQGGIERSGQWIGDFWQFSSQFTAWIRSLLEYSLNKLSIGETGNSPNSAPLPFGDYGNFGNRFGESKFISGTETVIVEPNEYQEYKTRQMRRAVRSTQRLILWIEQNY